MRQQSAGGRSGELAAAVLRAEVGVHLVEVTLHIATGLERDRVGLAVTRALPGAAVAALGIDHDGMKGSFGAVGISARDP